MVVADYATFAEYIPVVAEVRYVSVTCGTSGRHPHLPIFGHSATGSIGSTVPGKPFYESVQEGCDQTKTSWSPASHPEASVRASLELIKRAFDGAVSRVNEVFGVSRQTTHNWFSGAKTPRPKHVHAIAELAKAAKHFQDRAFPVTSSLLDRPLVNEKSFLELLASGADGQVTAANLIAVAQTDQHALAQLFTAYVPRSLRK